MCGGKIDSVTLQTRFQAKSDCDMGLACSRISYQYDVLSRCYEVVPFEHGEFSYSINLEQIMLLIMKI